MTPQELEQALGRIVKGEVTYKTTENGFVHVAAKTFGFKVRAVEAEKRRWKGFEVFGETQILGGSATLNFGVSAPSEGTAADLQAMLKDLQASIPALKIS